MHTKLLAPIDVSVNDISEQILLRALIYMKNDDSHLTLLAVAPNGADEAAMDEMRSKLMTFAEQHTDALNDRIELSVKQGLPSDQVLETAKSIQADVIFVGSHRGGQSQLGRPSLGSTAAKIASGATCDVHIVKTNSQSSN